MGRISADALNGQASLAALFFDPAKPMEDPARLLRPMAASYPMITSVVGPSTAGRQEGGQEHGLFARVAKEAIQHLADLPLRSMRPDRIREKVGELLAEDGSVKNIVRVEPRLLRCNDIRLNDHARTDRQSFGRRLDSAVMAGLEKVNQPVAGAQNSATDVQHLGCWSETVHEEINELFAAGELEVINRDAEERPVAQLFCTLL